MKRNYSKTKAEVEVKDIINLVYGMDSSEPTNIELLLSKLAALRETISKI